MEQLQLDMERTTEHEDGMHSGGYRQRQNLRFGTSGWDTLTPGAELSRATATRTTVAGRLNGTTRRGDGAHGTLASP